MNARGKLAVDIVSYLFSVISPHTKDRGPFLVQQEVDGSKTVCLTIRPLHANAAIGTPHHTVSANSRDEVGRVAAGAVDFRACCSKTATAGTVRTCSALLLSAGHHQAPWLCIYLQV